MKKCPLSLLLAVSLSSTAALADDSRSTTDAVSPLSFAAFYTRPIGPKGLEPGATLLALAGTRVQLNGFVARGLDVQTGLAILSPVPVALDDEDESLADDLPATVAYLHWDDPQVAAALAACPRAVSVTGRLELGSRAESDGRLSFVRLNADSVQCKKS